MNKRYGATDKVLVKNQFQGIALCFYRIVIFVLVLGVGEGSFADSNTATFSNNPLMAVVDGEPIRLDDLKNAGIQDALVHLYEMQARILKQKVIQKLIKNHPELQKEKPPEVTSSDIAQFYNNTPGVKEMGKLDQMKGEIRQYLEKSFKDSFYESRYQMAIEKGWVVNHIKAPNDFHLVAKTGQAVLFFEDKAENQKKVFVLEYSDFQCPFCKRVQATLGKLRHTYADKVQFGYRHFPLPFHKEAKDLAEAVECARDQGKFWELQADFYAATATIHRKETTKHAERIGVKNMRDFQACMDKEKYRNKVEQDVQDGAKLGVQGTPTFILGIYDMKAATVTGEMFSGAMPEDEFVRRVEKYISLSESRENTVSIATNPQ